MKGININEKTKETRNYNIYRLSDDMTDAEWQQFFTQMKVDIKPTGIEYMAIPENEQQDVTCDFQYEQFINDILDAIRQGEIDYCYYIFQIRDLLMYEPRLKAQWLQEGECFELSI